MGRVFAIGRLAVADVRHHRIEAALLVLAITASTASLALGLALHGVTKDPYQRTRAATAGPDVVAGLVNLAPPPLQAPAGPPSGHETLFSNDEQPSKTRTADFDALIGAPGVVAHSGPYPVAWATLDHAGTTAGVAVEGRDRARAVIDQPLLTKGDWLGRSGEAVVEGSFAASLGIHVGDHVTLNGKQFRVVGLAVTAALPAYPSSQTALGGSPFPDPGLVWVTQADATALASATLPLSYLLNLKLAPSTPAQAFVASHAGVPVSLLTADDILRQDGKLIAVEQRALTVGSWLLGLLAVASVAVLVGGRMAEQERRVGLLKAIGATPALVAAVLLVEDLALALGAALVGVLIGWVAGPLLTGPGAGLLGGGGAPSITASNVGLIVAVAMGIATVATLVPTVRAARRSTIHALSDAARPPRRGPRLIGLSRRLPVPVLLGTRLAARRPRRTILAGLSIAVTVTTVVAVLTVETHQTLMNVAGFSAIDNPRTDRINHPLLLISTILLVLAAINAVFITWTTAIDAREPLTIARALGATPSQVTRSLSAAQVIPALPGALLGLPAGTALVSLLSHGDTTPPPPAWTLAAVVLATLLAVATLTSIPARLSTRHPIAEALQAT